jgi:dTDP-glucose pyrophosphorylase
MLDIRYVFQPDDEYGPGAAIKAWKDSVKEPFLVLFGDNFYRGRLKEFDMEKNDCVVSYQRR